MPKVDAHQHFWKYSPDNYGWINNDMSILKEDYLPDKLQVHLEKNGFDGCVAVQARQNEEENDFLLGLADEFPFIKGVVGWVDLQADNVEERLEALSQNPKICGLRHLVQDERDDRFLLRKKFVRGVKSLKKFNLCYDILIFPKHLSVAKELVKQCPDQKFVVDHIAKPIVKDGIIEPWARGIRRIALHPNICCKISGMVTEARWHQWKKEDFRPYLDVIFDAFGTERIMIGSDWPVCKLSAEYDDVIGIVTEYISQLSFDEQENIMGGNAVRFYNLKV